MRFVVQCKEFYWLTYICDYSLIVTLKCGILSQSTAVFPLSVENVLNTRSCMKKNTVIYSETSIILKNTVISIFGHTARHYMRVLKNSTSKSIYYLLTWPINNLSTCKLYKYKSSKFSTESDHLAGNSFDYSVTQQINHPTTQELDR